MSLSRRKFIGGMTTAGAGLYLGILPALKRGNGLFIPQCSEPLLDWSDWEKYRSTVQHPCLTIKTENLDFAHENIKLYGWARDYASNVERIINRHLHLITPAFLEKMIEETTPGDPLWTPCPACRDQEKPVHPHGLFTWEIENPDQIRCSICGTVFPDDKYPEDIALNTKWKKPQTITYYGGEPFVIFGYTKGRPSFSANIRSRKVQWIANYCHTLAEGYLLTNNLIYAEACKSILLRLADCYPAWLVHVGYGEYADMDPRVAAMNISNLPVPELCPPPNEPDNSLWTGFWTAGRAGGVGLESDFIRNVVSAYDFTCNAINQRNTPVYTEDEKLKIERDLLLESTILLVCDKKINNKSVSNHTAVALVGMCVGHPGLLRFGLDGFNKTVDGWYLSDGTSSETPFYGLMALGGIWDMAQAAHGYSDPQGYIDESGKRIDLLDLYHNTSYGNVLNAFFKGLQGDLCYPPYADSFHNTSLDVSYVELMVANFPEHSEYLSLLKALCGNDLTLHSGSQKFKNKTTDNKVDDEPVLTLPYDLAKPTGSSSFSFYYRRPNLEKKTSPVLTLNDWCPPQLRIGHLRTGVDGRESLLLMSASGWGNHHENDSLNLYYWKEGHEVLSDLGYLWDHPLKTQNIRTVAHNTVLIDEKNQVTKERGGKVLLFKSFDHVKVMEMSSSAYPEASLYRRTSAIIDHGNGQSYVVDFFRVEGGMNKDYVFHGVGNACKVSDIKLKPITSSKLYDFSNIRTGDGDTVWTTEWHNGDNMTCVAWSVGQHGEQAMVADGWGQRDWKNSDINATIPYIVRRCNGEGVKTFISLFEGYQGSKPFIEKVKLIDKEGIIIVETAIGTDYIMSMPDKGIMEINSGRGLKKVKAHFAVGSVMNKKLIWDVLVP
ncbi:MAG: heparinase II/III-family protein [Bacteroidales bacterium]|nr:heparinase II/III-family protein [Bacteroidales bacterium]